MLKDLVVEDKEGVVRGSEVRRIFVIVYVMVQRR